MKRVISFDAYEAGSSDIVQAFYPIRSLPGVNSVEVLSATSGSPQWCVVIDVDDARDGEVVARMEALGREYAGYHSGMTNRGYRKVG